MDKVQLIDFNIENQEDKNPLIAMLDDRVGYSTRPSCMVDTIVNQLDVRACFVICNTEFTHSFWKQKLPQQWVFYQPPRKILNNIFDTQRKLKKELGKSQNRIAIVIDDLSTMSVSLQPIFEDLMVNHKCYDISVIICCSLPAQIKQSISHVDRYVIMGPSPYSWIKEVSHQLFLRTDEKIKEKFFYSYKEVVRTASDAIVFDPFDEKINYFSSIPTNLTPFDPKDLTSISYLVVDRGFCKDEKQNQASIIAHSLMKHFSDDEWYCVYQSDSFWKEHLDSDHIFTEYPINNERELDESNIEKITTIIKDQQEQMKIYKFASNRPNTKIKKPKWIGFIIDCVSFREYMNVLKNIVLNGRHLQIRTIVTCKYVINAPPCIKSNTDAVFIGDVTEKSLERIYKDFVDYHAKIVFQQAYAHKGDDVLVYDVLDCKLKLFEIK